MGRRWATLLAVLLVASPLALPLAPGVSATSGRPSAGVPDTAAWPEEAVPGSLLVTTGRPTDAERVLAVVRDRGVGALAGARGRRIARRVVQVEVEPGTEASAARALSERPGVRSVEPDLILHASAEPDDERFDEQWAHVRTHAPAGWDVTTGNHSVRVAVLDDGVRGDHPDLAPNIRETQVNVADGRVTKVGIDVDNDPCGAANLTPGHGTNVAGVAGAAGDNGRQIAGVTWSVSIVDVALTHPDHAPSCQGYALSAVVAGIEYAASGTGDAVDVINLSLGAPADACPRAIQDAIDTARGAGAVVVASAGNDTSDRTQTYIPASCNGVLSVGATRVDDGVAGYSVGNAYLDLVAPGGDGGDGDAGRILTTDRKLQTDHVEGTSFAAPYVAGLAALLRSVGSNLTPDDIESLLERNTTDLGPSGFDRTSGWGLVDVQATLTAATSGRPVPAPADEPTFPVDESGSTLPPPSNDPQVHRVSADSPTTAPIHQAVAVSRELFAEEGAPHALLARDDVFADALAGSALGYGHGPILFTGSQGSLATATRRELQRVLEPGAPVYLLGGVHALPAGLEDEIRELGHRPVRLAGAQREDTAVAVAEEVVRLGLPQLDVVLLATRGNWPDAVTGGSLAAWFGAPILLTPHDRLAEPTREALRRLEPSKVYVLGGQHVVDDPVLREAERAAGGVAVRLAGATRDVTAVEIAEEMEALLAREHNALPGFVAAVNVDRVDGWSHILSASAISGSTAAVFVPLRDPGTGARFTDVGRDYVRGFGIDGLAIGGTDLVPEAVREELEQLLDR